MAEFEQGLARCRPTSQVSRSDVSDERILFARAKREALAELGSLNPDDLTPDIIEFMLETVEGRSWFVARLATRHYMIARAISLEAIEDAECGIVGINIRTALQALAEGVASNANG